jgi:oligopeptidase A
VRLSLFFSARPSPARLPSPLAQGAAKERFNEIQQELSQLSTKFTNNLLDATKAYKKLLTDVADVAGLPESALAGAAQQAAKAGHEGATAAAGPWLFTLDFPSFFPVMTHATNRELRREMYVANITRASAGEGDNTPIIGSVLALRAEKARLLGFASFAEVSMASKMATLESAHALLEQLRAAAVGGARRDLQDIKDHAAAGGFAGELAQWDVSFWAERLKESKYSISDEELRPYFALPTVLEGLFALASRLFGVDIEAADGAVPVWHPDVRFFAVKKDGKPKAFFYLGASRLGAGLTVTDACSATRRAAAGGIQPPPHPWALLPHPAYIRPPCPLLLPPPQTPTRAPPRSAAAPGWTRSAASRASSRSAMTPYGSRSPTWCATKRPPWATPPR